MARALVGTEGTCAIVARATIRLVRPPAARCLLVLAFADDIEGAAVVPALLTEGPFTVESLSAELLELAPHPGMRSGFRRAVPGCSSKHEGTRLSRRAACGTAGDGHRPHPDVAGRPTHHERGRTGRALAHPRGWRGSFVAPRRRARRLARLRGLGRAARAPGGLPARAARAAREHDLPAISYGHFGEGCLHLRVGFGLDRAGGEERFRRFMEAAADLVVAHGGSLSGSTAMAAPVGPCWSASSAAVASCLHGLPHLWDPAGVLNPHIIVLPRRSRLTCARRHRALDVRPAQAYSHDGGDFRSAVERCIGVGRCVSTQGSELMCPSFRATRDEQHSTRGRARLLQEMVAGSLAADGWASKEVRGALDLCLACRGCVSQCPTSVDMATYKSEFLHHHYRRRLRPLSHYSLGWLPIWLRLVAALPRPLARQRHHALAPDAARLHAGGRHRHRARHPTHRSAALHARAQGPAPGPTWQRVQRGGTRPRRALAGLLQRIPDPGRRARRGARAGGGRLRGHRARADGVLRIDLAHHGPAGHGAGGCFDGRWRGGAGWRRSGGGAGALLRDDAARGSQRTAAGGPARRVLAGRVSTLAEILDIVGFVAPRSAEVAAGQAGTSAAIAQPHCHQQAVLGLGADRRVMERNGIAVGKELSGCCGLAGNFGAERGHEAIAQAVAELELLPALRAADPETPLLADGFSCRTQIEALSGQRARHLAEVLADRL